MNISFTTIRKSAPLLGGVACFNVKNYLFKVRRSLEEIW